MATMTMQEWETLKDTIATLYEGRLRVLRVGAYEDDGICLMPLDEGSGMCVPKLSVERTVYDWGEEGSYTSYTITLADLGRQSFNCLPLTDMSETYARMSIEFAVSCLFGVNDEEEKRLAKRA